MRILIIEDELLLSARLQKLLRELEPDAQLFVCNSVCSGVEWLKLQAQPDLILMDVELADGQCFDIFSEATITAPVIFTTAYDESDLSFFKGKALGYLSKPVRSSDLRLILEKFHSMNVAAGQPF